MQLAKSLSEHFYPPIFLRFPALIRFVHGWNGLFFQRNWLTHHALRRLLPSLLSGSLVLDAGCGEGQHLFAFAQKFPRLRFLGVDKNEAHVTFCRAYANVSGLNNLGFWQHDMTDPTFVVATLADAQVYSGKSHLGDRKGRPYTDLENQVDVLLCIGTLQYVENDRQALENFRKALKINGSLLLYVPVNGRTVLPFYRYFFERLDHYEKRQNRRRIYSPQEVLEKLAAAGLTVRQQKYTHGWLGILSHEIYSLLLMGVGNGGSAGALFFGGMLVVLLPLLLVVKVLDEVFPKKTGNGLFLVANT